LREVGLRETHRGLREDLGRLQQAAYCTALVEQATEAETPLPHVFDLMLGLVQYLTVHPPQPQTVFAFELKLLTELGLKPDLDKSRLNPGTRQLVRVLAEEDWPVVARLRAATAQEAELGHFLHGFLIYHLGRMPKGRNAALGLPR
jgi:hypothetical protein